MDEEARPIASGDASVAPSGAPQGALAALGVLAPPDGLRGLGERGDSRPDAFEAAFRASPVALALARDPHCAVVLRNAAMNRLVPASLDWHHWRLPAGAAPPTFEDGRPLPIERQPLRLAAFRGEPTSGREIEFRWPDREPVFLSVSAAPLFDARGAPCGAVASAVDVTADRFARQALSLRSGAEADAQRDTDIASRAKDELFALLGHELRNPMNAISTAAEVLNRADPLAPEAASARRIILRQTRRLAELLGELGEVSRTLADRPVLRRETVELAVLVERCAALAGPAAAARGQRLALTLAPLRVDADALQLGEAVLRLIEDALRRAPDGQAIALRLRPDPRPGVAEAILEIGDAAALGPADAPVEVAPAESVRATQRLGLALSLVRLVAERHGGRIDAGRPDPGGGGQTLVLRLPRLD